MPLRYNLPMPELPPDFAGGSGPIRLARFLLKKHEAGTSSGNWNSAILSDRWTNRT